MIMIKQYIEIKTDFEALHNWPECPYDDVFFLKNLHRHKIYIKVKIETTKDRQIEFFKFKYYIDDLIEKLFGNDRLKNIGRKSMEEICTLILNNLILEYKESRIIVTASEDDQVSGIVEYDDTIR
jgi:6-pyruvoyl-tetrahydropterin synthase